MASTHYVGQTPSITELLGEGQPRYFYALRRTEDGTLFFAKIDQLKDVDTITINNPGAATGDFTEFEYGVDFFDGRIESAGRTKTYNGINTVGITKTCITM